MTEYTKADLELARVQAQKEAEEYLMKFPSFSIDRLADKLFPYKHQKDKDLIIGALRKAGLD